MQNAQADTVDLTGVFQWDNLKANLKLTVKDLRIDGLTIPKFSWGWVGLSIAQGVLSAFGGAIFSALIGALLSSGKEPDIGRLLNEQLEAFARIVARALKQEVVWDNQARLSAYLRLYREYLNDPVQGRFDFLINESGVLMSQLETLGLAGYRTYISAVGLRLALLQDRARKHGSEGARRNFVAQREAADAHHKAQIAEIRKQTNPLTYGPGVPTLDANIRLIPLKTDIFDQAFDGLYAFKAGAALLPKTSGSGLKPWGRIRSRARICRSMSISR